MKEFFSYEAPQVEVIEVEVEKGFATSSTDVNQNDPMNPAIGG